MEMPPDVVIVEEPFATPSGIFFRGRELKWYYRVPNETYQSCGIVTNKYTMWVNYKEASITFQGRIDHKICKELKEQFGFKKHKAHTNIATVDFTN